jgi:hypothetical protein
MPSREHPSELATFRRSMLKKEAAVVGAVPLCEPADAPLSSRNALPEGVSAPESRLADADGDL